MTFTLDKDLDDKIAVLYLLGYSAPQVARRLTIKVDYVNSSLKRTGTPRRSRKEAKLLAANFSPVTLRRAE